MDSTVWSYILRMNPFTKQDDIIKCLWINSYDLFVEFKDGKKFIYDTYTNYFRFYYYDSKTITEQEWKNEFKIKLNKILERTHTTQKMLADKLGITQQMISKYCRGEIMPSQYTIHKIALVLDCKDEDLLYQDY